MRGRFAWADVKAGYTDATRMTKPRVRVAFRIGAWDYRLGYLVAMTRLGQPWQRARHRR